MLILPIIACAVSETSILSTRMTCVPPFRRRRIASTWVANALNCRLRICAALARGLFGGDLFRQLLAGDRQQHLFLTGRRLARFLGTLLEGRRSLGVFLRRRPPCWIRLCFGSEY